MHPNFSFHPMPIEIPSQPEARLTYDERKILSHIGEAWNAFIDLPNRSADDTVQFRYAVHELQALIAVRVARRADKDVWVQV